MKLITTKTQMSGRSASHELDADQLREWLVERLAQMLEVDAATINTELPFAEYGLGSMSAVRIAGDLEKLLGREVPATLTWDYPTIEQVVQFVCTP